MSAVLDLNTTRQSLNLPVDPVAQAREIASTLRAEASKIEALGRLTPTVVDALHARGLYRVLLPKQLNGYGAGLETFVKVMETLAAADASTCLVRRSGEWLLHGRGLRRCRDRARNLG